MKQATLGPPKQTGVNRGMQKGGRSAWFRNLAVGLKTSAAYLFPPFLALLLAMLAWQLYVRLADKPEYLVPAPTRVISKMWEEPGFLAANAWTTTYEALAGFALGSAIAVVLAILMAHSRLLERSLYPIAVMVKVTPVVAVAPMFIIWFGFGVAPKIFIAALITFFPVLVNAVTGFRDVSPNALEFLRSVNASPIEILIKLRVPSALPYLFAAFKVSATLSVIGAFVAEWIGSSKGLGHVLALAHSTLDMRTLFAAVILLAIIGTVFVVIISLLERRLLFWHDSARHQNPE